MFLPKSSRANVHLELSQTFYDVREPRNFLLCALRNCAELIFYLSIKPNDNEIGVRKQLTYV